MNRSIFFAPAIAFAFLNISVAQDNSDPVLMTVGDTKVTLSEFESVYKKNSSKEETTKEGLDKYLELFTNFKLKVKEAEEMGLDTSAAFKEELKGYRKQLSQPYLTDKEVNEKLLKEAYDRMNWDVKASHILIKVAENALPKDTLDAYNKIMKIRARILKGENFAAVAKGTSDDPSAKENGGDLGYFTALQMVYPFESVAYNTKIGEVSMPVRTKFGYHIIKVNDKRKAQGEILVAHIMVATKEGISKEDSLNAKTKIDELYEKVKTGDFAELARTHSDDKQSGKKGGELPWFGTNRMPLEFEQAAFALKNNGDYSAPIKTKYGWHIIKRLDKKEVPAFEAIKNELKTKVSKDSRSQQGRQSLIAKAKQEFMFKENLKARDEFYKVIDTSVFEGSWKADKAKMLNKTMFTLMEGGTATNFTQKDFADYIASHQSKRAKIDVKAFVNQLYNQFVEESIITYKEARLDKQYPEFRALMQEYRDGILLFELTDKKVWSKAIKDTVGLKEFYEKNKNNYMWDERVEATVYSCANEKVAADVRKMLAKKKSEKEILETVNKNSQLNLNIETKTFTKGENAIVDANWKVGTSGDVKADNKVNFVLVSKVIKPEPKSFNEAKGLVTADYQTQLEKEWIESLKQKYKVTVNRDVLAKVK